MEGYDYIKAQQDVDGNRTTKAPVISQDIEKMGLTQRAVNDLFREIKRVKEEEGKHINIFCSFLQIYNERVYDLLNETSLQTNSKKNQSNVN